jgi:alpha-N-acetylglucosaminidase
MGQQPEQPEQPVQMMLARVVGSASAAQFDLLVGPVGDNCASKVHECAVLADGPAKGRISIQGTSVSSLAFGIGMYLRERCNSSLTWVKTGGMQGAKMRCGDPAKLPKVGVPMSYARQMKYTYYQNVVDSSYSFAFWDSARWEKEIDWMALSGINLALMYTGQELVLRDLYAEHGINLTNTSGTSTFFNGPAFLSWSRGQNQADVGGYDRFVNSSVGSLPAWWIEQQATLGKWQAGRMRALGIRTILRGFEGNVPEQLQLVYPRANISQISKTGYLGAAWKVDALDPTD